MTSISEISETVKGETENEGEKIKKSKKVNKSSKIKIEKGEEKEIFFIIFFQRKEKENTNVLVFSEDCDILPTIIIINSFIKKY